MRRRFIRYASTIAAAAILGLGFQNCGKAGFDGLDQGLTISTSQSDSFPFAFEATFDQIAYNSCFGAGTAGRPGFYTLMGGAYTTAGGVKIRPEFFNYVRTSGVVQPIYPATTIDNTQMKMVLASSGTSVDAIPTMALRSLSAPQQVRTPGAQEPTVGLDYVPMLGDLTDDRWMDPLVKNEGVFTNFFNLAPSGGRNLEAKITYNKDEGVAEGLRMDLGSYSRLALTFKPRSDQAPDSGARPVDVSNMNKVYGKSYKLNFQTVIAPYTWNFSALSGSYVPYGLTPSNILTEVEETDLSDTSKPMVRWNCPQQLRYLVVRTTDHPSATNGDFCPRDPFSYMVSGIPSKGISVAQYRAEYEIMRRSLKEEYWDISVEFRCAVPKPNAGECYPAEQGAAAGFGIQYDQQQPCYSSLPGLPYTNPIPTKRCAQYVSVCLRQ